MAEQFTARRVLNLLGQCLVYPELGQIDNLRQREEAEFSVTTVAKRY
jgi:hypothetical protein